MRPVMGPGRRVGLERIDKAQIMSWKEHSVQGVLSKAGQRQEGNGIGLGRKGTKGTYQPPVPVPAHSFALQRPYHCACLSSLLSTSKSCHLGSTRRIRGCCTAHLG